MTLEISRIWFEEQLQRLTDGAKRMAELNSLPWRFPGKRGPSKPRAKIGQWSVGGLQLQAPAGLQHLALDARKIATNDDDKLLLFRAGTGFALQPWELRRVEYLALKLTARTSLPAGPEAAQVYQNDFEAVEGDVDTGRKSEPAVGELRGGVSPSAGRGSVLVRSSRRQEAREMATPARNSGGE